MLRQVPSQALPDVDVIRESESLRHDAHNQVRRPVEIQRLADDRSVGVVSRPPQAVADDGDEVVREEGAVGGEPRSNLGADTEHGEQISARLDGLHADGVEAGIEQVDVWTPPRRGIGKRRQRLVVDEGHRRKRIVAQALLGVRVPELHQPLRGAIRQRPQHDRVDDGVDDRGGAGAEAEDQNRDESKGRVQTELAQCHPKGIDHCETPESRCGRRCRWRGARATRAGLDEVRAGGAAGLMTSRAWTASRRALRSVGAALDGREVQVFEVRRQFVDRGWRQIDPGRARVPRHQPAPGGSFVRGRQVSRHRFSFWSLSPGPHAYLTPATWPRAATNRAQSSRWLASTFVPASVIR